MNSETRNCQNCKKNFIIEPDDFLFYEKIKVPPPTFCSECRMQRRMSFYNLNNLFKKKDYKTGESIFSSIPEESPFKIYESSYWWGDNWDPAEYGQDYDFSKSFFEQFKEFSNKVPFQSRSISNLVNSDYSANATDIKNCYLLFNAQKDENCLYGVTVNNSKESIDSYCLYDSELCYDTFFIKKSYKTFYSENCFNCQDVYLSKDLQNCHDCVACISMNNKKYCILNEQYSKEEYERKIKELNLSSYKNLDKLKTKAKILFLKFPRKFMHGIKNLNVSGNYIDNSKNVINSFIIKNSENIKYSYNLSNLNNKDSYDHSSFGNNTELIYESQQVGNSSSNIKFSYMCYNGNSFLEYCMNCMSSSYLFGCISLKGKSYCILNKQYEKEEYFQIIEKIKKHMNEMPYIDKNGNIYKYGEFFPFDFSPFPYNRTVAQEYFPLTKKDAEIKCYKWKDKEERNYNIDIKNEDIPDDINDVNEDILGRVIECKNKGDEKTQCTEAFKIIEPEYQFYKRMKIPIPHLCPNCRHYERLSQRNPLKLWHRKCMHEGCNNEFETSYSPDRPEIIYCEKCYQQEVY